MFDPRKIATLHARAYAGDPAARSLVAHAAERARYGDPKAAAFVRAIGQVDAHKRATRVQIAARDLYAGLQAGSPQAWQRLQNIRRAEVSGHAGAGDVMSILRSIHLQKKALSGTGPGAPRTGTFPMPYQHRVGVDIPGLGNVPIPSIPGLTAPAAPQALPGQYLVLTPDALATLLAFIQQIIRSAGPMTFTPRPSDDLPIAVPSPNTARPVTALQTAPQLRSTLYAQTAPYVQASSDLSKLRTTAYHL